jgi:hypothetical protein
VKKVFELERDDFERRHDPVIIIGRKGSQQMIQVVGRWRSILAEGRARRLTIGQPPSTVDLTATFTRLSRAKLCPIQDQAGVVP